MRVLFAWHVDDGQGDAGREPLADGIGSPESNRGQPVPVHRLCTDRQGHFEGERGAGEGLRG